MTRQALTKHLAVLERANLTTVWHGHEKLHYLNPIPMQQMSDRWISKYERARLPGRFEVATGKRVAR
jgi:hypothetical protein